LLFIFTARLWAQPAPITITPWPVPGYGIAPCPDGRLIVAGGPLNQVWALVRLPGGALDFQFVAGVGGQPVNPPEPDGTPAMQVHLNLPMDVGCDSLNQVYISERSGNRVRYVDTQGRIQTAAPTVRGAAGLLIEAPNRGKVASFDLQGGAFPGNRVYAFNAGVVTPFAGTGAYGYAGDGGPALQAQFRLTGYVAAYAGQTLITDYNNNAIRGVNAAGTITTFSVGPTLPAYVTVAGDGNAYVYNNQAGVILRVATNGDETWFATLAGVTGMSYWEGMLVAAQASAQRIMGYPLVPTPTPTGVPPPPFTATRTVAATATRTASQTVSPTATAKPVVAPTCAPGCVVPVCQ